jgi:hypothetical protein
MPIRISRNDDRFVAISRFTYQHYPSDAFCSVVREVALLFPGGGSLPLRAVDPNRPFAGIRDRSGHAANLVPVDIRNNDEDFELGISPKLFFEALDRELPRLWFRDNAAIRVVRVKIGVFRVSRGNPGVSKPIQVDANADVEVEIGAAAAAAPGPGEERLQRIPLPRLRRDDRSFSRNDLTVVVEPDGAAGSPIRVKIDQGAPRRFAREALFAFAPPARRVAGEDEIYPFVFARLSAADFADADLRLLRQIVLCTATEVPLDQTQDADRTANAAATADEEKFGWELSRVSALPELAAEQRGPAAHAALYRLSVAQTYALCVELSELEFEIERLFPGQRDRLVIELALFGSDASNEPFEVYQLELALSRSERRLLLVSAKSGHFAAVIDVEPAAAATAISSGAISLLEHSPGQDQTATIRNLARGPVECQVMARPAMPDRITFGRGDKAVRSFGLDLVGGHAQLRIGNATVDFELLPPAEARIVALDIGTMAMSMATGAVTGGGTIEAVSLGAMVTERVPKNTFRREADYSDLMSSACGITILEGNGSTLPAQCVSAFLRDPRLARWLETGRHRDDLLARLALTKAPLEIHLPLYDRRHEDLSDFEIQRFGLAWIASVKTQICTYPLLRHRSRLWTHAVTLAAPAPPEDMPLQKVETQTLLAAALDALIYVYSPAGIGDPAAAERDWDFVLTHPASIGTDARQRYYKALRYLVNRKQADFDLYLDKKRPGSRGRVRLRLVPEPVAACWALLHSAKLPQRQPGKLRRLILFDIGAGTFDVSALEIYRGNTDEIVSQTVCFSVPLGGDTLDRAIAWDYLCNPVFKGQRAEDDVSPDLLSRIEAGKRERNFGPRFLPIPMAEGEAGVTPHQGDNFVGWVRSPNAAQFPPPASRKRITWAMIDLEDRSQNPSLQAYLRVVRKFIVEPTLRACGRYEDTFVDVDIVISGRAGFFAPLRDAIQEAVGDAIPEAVDPVSQRRKLQVRLACDVLSDTIPDTRRAPSRKDAELMKGLVAHGAALWSRNASCRDATKTIEQPPRAVHALSSFAVLIGSWDYEFCGFEYVQELRDVQDFERPRSLGGPAFIVTRPPFASADDVRAALGDKAADNAQAEGEQESVGQVFTQELIDRCLRPIALEHVETLDVAAGSPLPYIGTGLEPDVHGAILRKIQLAGPGDVVKLDCRVEGSGQVHLSATVNGKARGSWTLSSTFMVQEG